MATDGSIHCDGHGTGEALSAAIQQLHLAVSLLQAAPPRSCAHHSTEMQRIAHKVTWCVRVNCLASVDQSACAGCDTTIVS